MRFLAIGECMAELAPTDVPGSYRLGFAGDTFNTAWYISQLQAGAQVAYLTAIGTDAMSQQMRAFAEQSGIDGRHIQTVPDRTLGLYLISLQNGERSFSYWRDRSAARLMAADRAALKAAMQDADLIYLSGITLAVLEGDGRATLSAALRQARMAGKRVTFDPNLRPRLWQSPEEMTAAIMACAALSDIVLPSFEDEASWFGDADPAATLDRYAAVGVETVIAKDGPNPVLYCQGAARGSVPVAPVADIVDTTAAGDSFNAGLLASLQAGQPLEHAIARACRLSGQVVQGKGALVPVPPNLLEVQTGA